jgi:hypothetical protein
VETCVILRRAGLPVGEIVAVADTVGVRSDPQPIAL